MPEAPEEPGAAPQQTGTSPALRDVLVESMGGKRGLFDSGLPVVVFVLVTSLVQPFGGKDAALGWALGAALACGLAVLVLRLVRRESPQQAIAGFLPLAIAAWLARRSGDARDFYLPYILYQVAYAAAFLVSVVVRHPLVGHIYAAVDGEDGSWRTDRRVRRVFALASLGWALVFGVRAAVQGALYAVDRTGWLAAARLLMGWPLTIAAVAATVAFVKRRRAQLEPDAAAVSGATSSPAGR